MDKIIEPRYKAYFESCYRGLDISETQRKEVKQAFYAGYIDFCEYMLNNVANLCEEEGAARMEQIRMEAIEELAGGILPKN